MNHKPDDIMTIGLLQLEVLNEMWRKAGLPVTVAHIFEILNLYRARDKRPILAYTTYLTVMRNLARRKLIQQTIISGKRGHQFTPLISEREYRDRVMDFIKINVYSGDAEAFYKDVGRRYLVPV